MKTRSLLFLLIGCYFLVTCDDGFLEAAMPVEMEEEEEQVVYPLKYTYTGVDFQPTEFYTYQIDSFEQITISEGVYTLLDSFLFAELYDETNEEGIQESWPFPNIDLLSDTLLRMKIEVPEENIEIDTTFSYRKESNFLYIDYFGTEAIFETEKDNNIRLCSQTYGFNYFNETRERREDSPFDKGSCEYNGVDDLLVNIMERFSNINFQKNDTFFVNYSYYIMDLAN